MDKETNTLRNDEDVLLRVEHLCQYFKVGHGKYTKAVDDVSFDIKKGEVFGLVGESGCGKTTTGRSIIKIYDITSGSIYFKGTRICAGTGSYLNAIKQAKAETASEIAKIRKSGDPSAAERIAALKAGLKKTVAENRAEIEKARFDHKKSDKVYAESLVKKCDEKYKALIAAASDEEEKKKLGKEWRSERRIASKTRLITKIQMIFQDPIASLNPRMTVREIISEGMVINGIRDKEYIDEKVYGILNTVGLVPEHAGRYPHEFSGGQRQRIGIARSVVMEPDLIIADEPVSALDVSIQAQVINLLNDLRRQMGLTIMFIAHDLSVVKYFSDRIGVMYYGKMVELAEADELFAHPMHPYTRSLLSAIPLPDPHYEKNHRRITYNPLKDHDYSSSKPTMREIGNGHFVLCDDAEEKKYRAEFGID
ncbi:MAG: ATP-binding cassette domain-containing protein [Clostridia bacterium]|nr:ATP-binding cassette domain-containing protein [Clostridia bacterium]